MTSSPELKQRKKVKVIKRKDVKPHPTPERDRCSSPPSSSNSTIDEGYYNNMAIGKRTYFVFMVKQMCGKVKNEAKICRAEHPIQLLETLNNSNNSLGNIMEETVNSLLFDSIQKQQDHFSELSLGNPKSRKIFWDIELIVGPFSEQNAKAYEKNGMITHAVLNRAEQED